MEFTDFLIYKAVVLCVIVAVVNFVYAFITGQTLEEARRDTSAAERPDSAKNE